MNAVEILYENSGAYAKFIRELAKLMPNPEEGAFDDDQISKDVFTPTSIQDLRSSVDRRRYDFVDLIFALGGVASSLDEYPKLMRNLPRKKLEVNDSVYVEIMLEAYLNRYYKIFEIYEKVAHTTADLASNAEARAVMKKSVGRVRKISDIKRVRGEIQHELADLSALRSISIPETWVAAKDLYENRGLDVLLKGVLRSNSRKIRSDLAGIMERETEKIVKMIADELSRYEMAYLTVLTEFGRRRFGQK